MVAFRTPFPTLPRQAGKREVPEICIARFKPQDQAAVKALILAGLVEHWGALDPSKNPDLEDISSSYAGAVFLTARQGDEIVGTGALLPRGNGVGEIVRMSVARHARRLGIGSLILEQLCAEAKALGYSQVVLETTDTWQEAIAFYLRFGFQITHYSDGDVYFKL